MKSLGMKNLGMNTLIPMEAELRMHQGLAVTSAMRNMRSHSRWVFARALETTFIE